MLGAEHGDRGFQVGRPGLANDRQGVRLTRHRVSLQALAPLDLPAYLGSTLRGAFAVSSGGCRALTCQTFRSNVVTMLHERSMHAHGIA